MKISDASPFVRFAFRFTFTPKKELFTALDNRIMYFHSGKGFIKIDDVKYRIEPDTFILWQAGCLYNFLLEDEMVDISSINFDFTYDRRDIRSYFDPVVIDSPQTINKYNIIKTFFKDAPELSSPIIIHNAHKMRSMIAEIITFQNPFQPFSDEKKTALLYNCIIDVLRHNRMDNEAKKVSQSLNTVLQYISQNYRENISNDTLAELVGYHPYYLNRLFNKSTGKTLHQYLTFYRLEVAEQMLRTTDLSVSAISENCGFSSIISFETNFKKKNSVSPTEYRKIIL